MPNTNLLADCSNCFGLCCVALPFAASSDFAVDKGAGEPCTNLQADFRCAIHARLRTQGFAGCTVYDCLGAGQQVSSVTFEGRDWRTSPKTAAQMFRVFPIMRQLHELLFYLREALCLTTAADLLDDLRAAEARTEALTGAGPAELLELDVAELRGPINELLLLVSRQARGAAGRAQTDRRGADLIGIALRGADLRGANLRRAYLIGADLSGADLRLADLIGADLRGANLCGADLSNAIFLTQFQINAAKGDGRTKLPATLIRPSYWVVRSR